MKVTQDNKNNIIKAYAQRMVEDLDTKTLVALAIDNYEHNMWSMDLKSVEELVKIYAPDLLEDK
jgi:hypothetical protein